MEMLAQCLVHSKTQINGLIIFLIVYILKIIIKREDSLVISTLSVEGAGTDRALKEVGYVSQ